MSQAPNQAVAGQIETVALVHLIKSVLESPNGVEITVADFQLLQRLPDYEMFRITPNAEGTAFRVTHTPSSVQ